jgi:DNA-binding CsgD family transcriptional regulator
MTMPGARDLKAGEYRAGLRLMQSLAATDSVDAFARRGVQLLAGLVASELTTLSVCDLASGRRHVVGLPAGAIGATDRAAFDRHFSEHPLVRHHTVERGRDTHRISDSVPLTRFRHSALYAEYYRHIGIDHVIAVPLHFDQRTLVSFVLNRSGRDFSDRERALLDALRPALGELYRHTVALDRARATASRLRDALDGARVGAIRLDLRGNVRDFSAPAAQLVHRLWGISLRRGRCLPAPLDAVITRPPACWPVAGTLPDPVRTTLGGRLTVRTCPATVPDDGLLVLLEPAAEVATEVATEAAPPVLQRWPLSRRERDVLHWVAAGKTDSDIGAILGISTRTVHKHLQHVYDKLGVETRTAAVMRVLGTR